jgi:hypothetical protein
MCSSPDEKRRKRNKSRYYMPVLFFENGWEISGIREYLKMYRGMFPGKM